MVDKIKIFISYAEEDEGLRKELETQLGTLERRNLIQVWHNRRVSAGADVRQEITKHLNTAQVILLLISTSYMASDDPYNVEMKRAMEKLDADKARVIPILLRPTLFKGAPFEHLKMLPTNRRAVTSSSWHNHDEAFFDVIEGIQEVVEELTAQPQTPALSAIAQNSPSKEIPMPSQQQQEFDVFLCHNSDDKPEVKRIAEQLKAHGIKPWLDEWELPPGLPWQRLLEAQIGQIKSAAVFVGKDGVGPWQRMELEALLREFVHRGCPVIPVVLRNAPTKPQLPLFLGNMTWVDFRKLEPDPMERLIWGITGVRKVGTSADVGQVSNAASVSPTTSPGLTPWQRHVLEQKRDDLRKLWDTRNKKIQRLKEALAIENDVNTIVKYETQLSQEEAALANLTKELEDVEQALQ